MRQRTQTAGRRVEGRPLALDKEKRRPIEARAQGAEALAELALVRDYEPSGRGRCRGARVGGEIAERRVLLVPNRRNDRHRAIGHRANESLLAEGEEVFETSAASGEDDDVHARFPGEVARALSRARGRRAGPGRTSAR